MDGDLLRDWLNERETDAEADLLADGLRLLLCERLRETDEEGDLLADGLRLGDPAHVLMLPKTGLIPIPIPPISPHSDDARRART